VVDADKSHSKFIIVDAHVVLTGSFNFKPHADRVQRDNVVIRGASVAKTYAARFRALSIAAVAVSPCSVISARDHQQLRTVSYRGCLRPAPHRLPDQEWGTALPCQVIQVRPNPVIATDPAHLRSSGKTV
jgi:phosphatidylserine/phosphatidylglycerophosphate/cardiolipin synthase-like enzyme